MAGGLPVPGASVTCLERQVLPLLLAFLGLGAGRDWDKSARPWNSARKAKKLCYNPLALRFSLGYIAPSAALAQLVRAPDCGSGGPPFEPGRWYHSQHLSIHAFGQVLFLFYGTVLTQHRECEAL